MKVIDGLGVDDIFCLGDVIGKGAFPAEAVDVCRERCTETLRGNHEDFFLTDPDVDHYVWVRERLSEEQLRWLAERPVRKDLYLSGRKVRLCHAGPDDVHLRVYPGHDRKKKLELFKALDNDGRPPDVFGYGDVHYAYLEYFDSRRTLFNPGSVGNSMELPQASFAVITGILESGPADAFEGNPMADHTACSPFGIQFYRVPYDIEKEVRLTLSSSMPEKGRDIYIREIETGTWGKRWSRYT